MTLPNLTLCACPESSSGTSVVRRLAQPETRSKARDRARKRLIGTSEIQNQLSGNHRPDRPANEKITKNFIRFCFDP
jgi:hypothetical protein